MFLVVCDDVVLNIKTSTATHHNGLRAQLHETSTLLARHFAPRSGAYHEIWLNGTALGHRRSANGQTEETDSYEPKADRRKPIADEEPLYGKVYLPRKFKTGLALPEDNCIDVYAQDLGLLADVEKGRIVGYNVLVGG